ncbi:TPA: hypothetical protein DEP96_03905 [Candidatus Uhrbacteria bacterium]|nr:hypothetical protein [Candidatus Uhrbacteria bacterium]
MAIQKATSATAGKPGWYFTLVDKIQEVVRKFDLPEDISTEFRILTLEVARAQFKAGCKSGVAWLHAEQAKKALGVQVAVAA